MVLELPQRMHAVNLPALAAWRGLKFGMFIHWGIYSLPAGIWKEKPIPRLGEQIQRHARIPSAEYAALARRFDPVKYDARAIAHLAKEASMKYVVFTAKHHDGFCMFRTAHTGYNIVDATPYGRDVLAELADACSEEGLRLGLYYSNPDWHFPGAVRRHPANEYSVFEHFTPEHLAYSCNQLRELLTQYGPISELFFDMGLPTLEESRTLAKTVHECQPDCLVSGRVMNNQGDFLTLPDNHLPESPIAMAWETPGSFYHTWGHKSYIDRSPMEEQLQRQIRRLAVAAGLGGNYLLNIGPLADGSVHPYERDALGRLGEWMQTNGEAIHGTQPGPFKRLPWGHATQRDGSVYLHVTEPTSNGQLRLPGLKSELLSAILLGLDRELPVRRDGEDVVIELPGSTAPLSTMAVLKCAYEGPLEVDDPIVRQQTKDTIEIERGIEQSEGFHNSLQYNTNIPHVRKRWDLLVREPGTYQVELAYRLNGGDMPVVLKIGEQCLTAELSGEGTSRRPALSDGNEVALEESILPLRRVRLGGVQFARLGLETVELVKDGEKVVGHESSESDAQALQSPKARAIFREVWTAHRKAMAQSSLSGLLVESILLRREDLPAGSPSTEAPHHRTRD